MINTRELSQEEITKAHEVINKKLNPALIKSRSVSGKNFNYIEGSTVIRLLNEAFGFSWSFEITDEKWVEAEPKAVYDGWGKNKKPKLDSDGNQVYEKQAPIFQVKGRLTIPGLCVKEQYGTKIVLGGSSEQEGVAKSAATDALKKCATMLGVALDLYDGDIFEEEPATVTEPQLESYQSYKASAPAKEPTPPPAPVTDPVAMGEQEEIEWDVEEVTKLKTLKMDMGIEENDELNPYVKDFLGSPQATWEDITPSNIAKFNKYMEKKSLV